MTTQLFGSVATSCGTMTNTTSLKDSYFESFETFLQDLAPLTLSNDAENSKNHFPSTMLPQGVSKGTSLEISSDQQRNLGNNSKHEVKRLQDLVELLQVRLDALQKALEMQEQEVCREMEAPWEDSSCSNYEKLLTRWRREVCVMLLKQRVDALQFEQQQLQHTKKEHHLTVQLHEARALVETNKLTNERMKKNTSHFSLGNFQEHITKLLTEVLKQKEKNSQAEIAMLTTSTKVAEMTMRAEGARQQHEKEEKLKGASKATTKAITQIMEAQFDMMSFQMGKIKEALCRLDMHGRRLFFAEQQVAMAAGLISSNLKPKGVFHRKLVDVEAPRMPKWKESVTIDRQKMVDQVSRSNQLEVLLAATKTQLAEECLHARELQERLVKSEDEARECMKRATKKVQDQADRDLAAIKRQHGQAMLSLQQKMVKLQTDQARGVVSQHQLERKIHQLQQEFTQTLNQKDIEFKKSMEAKEVEVNHLLDEQNVLVVKLKKFWRPILNSPSAKIFNENKKDALQTQESSTEEKPKTSKSPKEINECFPKSSQTENFITGEKKCHCTTSFNNSRDEEYDSFKNQEAFPKFSEKDTSYCRLSTPRRKITRQRSRPSSKKFNDDDLIASFLAKLQKAYVKSRDVSSDPFATAVSFDPLQVPELRPTVAHSEDTMPTEGRHTPRSSVDSKESFEINDARSENIPRYVICIPRREPCNSPGNTFFLKTRRKKKVVASNHFLREKLEDLEDLSKSLLRGHLCD